MGKAGIMHEVQHNVSTYVFRIASAATGGARDSALTKVRGGRPPTKAGAVKRFIIIRLCLMKVHLWERQASYMRFSAMYQPICSE